MSLAPPNPILIADRFPSLLGQLIALLESLSDADWQLPTAAAGWSVKDIALHLLGGDIGYLSSKRDGFHEGWIKTDQWDELVGLINQNNRAWVQATRRTSPRLLYDLLRWTGEQFNAYILTLDPLATGSTVDWAGNEPAPVWLDLAREFTERWHHQQHIRDAVGRPGAVEPYFLAPVLATFVYALPRTYRGTRAPEGSCVSLTITGQSGDTWSVVSESGGWQLYLGKPDAPDAEVILPEDAAWKLFTKGISKEQALAQAQLLGNDRLAEQILEAVAILA